MLRPVDYDRQQHANYAAGRDLGAAHAQRWAAVFAAHAPAKRPLAVLDLGCGTGRFIDALAEEFGGPVHGVEPSDKMREAAQAGAKSPQASFLAGRAEAIPLADASCDLALMFLSFHHVRDREAAGVELARVLRPGGRLLIRSQFSDRFPELNWHAYFPRAREIELAMFPTLAEVERPLTAAGFRRIELVEVEEQFHASLRDHADRLKHRAISTFEHLTEAEIAEGFARLDAAVAAETTPQPVVTRSDLLVMAR